ncbi:hypothetical protein DFH08DRAFT_862117 [Mycena albidolilacea]|uniref:3-beta hydroxysteroid dehydrogenase/isomerase domain-containing protein n=1 Tax=Mycena albidolilacea TaxID=1033008 RepID=A0AAD7A6N2_9AGAR|nr:hypothetical protein DFH08DRAFT_862117 [Mycena albidolilacea]
MSQEKATRESYLIVGGGTSLGEAIVRLLLRRGETRISIFDALPLAADQVGEFGDYVRAFVGEIIAPKVVSDTIQSCQATCIIFTGMISTPVVRNITYPSVYKTPPTKTQREQATKEIQTVYRRTSIDGTRNLVSAVLEQNSTVKQLVFFGSAISMFDGIERPNLCEADVPSLPKPWIASLEPASIGERVVLGTNGQNGLATAVIRPARLFGPTHYEYMSLLRCQEAPELSAVCLGDNTNLSDTTFLDNAAHAGILAADRLAPGHLQHAATAGRAFLVSDDDPRPTWDLDRDLWAAASHTTPPTPVRVPHDNYVKKPGPLARLLGRTGLRTEEKRLRYWNCVTHTYDISLARDVLGYTPIVSHDEGIRRTAEWWLEKQRKLSALNNETQATTDNPYNPKSTSELTRCAG